MDMNTEQHENEPAAPGGGAIDIRHLTEMQLGRLGLSQIAYVRAVVVDGTPGFAIHAADGTPMAVAGNRGTALAAIVQHDMIPLLVH